MQLGHAQIAGKPDAVHKVALFWRQVRSQQPFRDFTEFECAPVVGLKIRANARDAFADRASPRFGVLGSGHRATLTESHAAFGFCVYWNLRRKEPIWSVAAAFGDSEVATLT